MLWHLNQAAPNYSIINPHALDNDGSNSDQQHSIIDIGHDQLPSTIHHRKRSIRLRTSTLTSIQEENEIEL